MSVQVLAEGRPAEPIVARRAAPPKRTSSTLLAAPQVHSEHGQDHHRDQARRGDEREP